MISPVVTHIPCDLDRQRALREAEVSARVRGRSLLARILRRPSRPRADFATHLGPQGEDVWHALRF